MKKTLLLAVALSMSAFAQETPPPPPEAPPPATATAADAPAAPQTDPGGRVRWGLGVGLGWHLPQSAFTLSAEGRIGYQVSNAFSAYAIVGGTFGLGLGVSAGIEGAQVTATVVSHWYLGALAELMLGNLFYIGAGPVLANGVLAGTTVGATSAGVAEITGIGAVGWKPGVDLRLGLGFGRPRPGSFRRGGFNLGLDAMLLFHPNAEFATVRADGPNGTAGATVNSSGLTTTLVPMLTLGYESR